MQSICELNSQVSEVRSARTRVDAFERFATVEKALEPIEDCVTDLITAIDAAIQLEIDIARGK
jgi:hypothetical protein